ncbi:MAG TPA: hypothetical protein IAA45_07825, partial [Candidatus Blautia gallistercoris]|nr:hypothetical protein [Candidatus Blautia gallistercoris]
DSPPAAGCLWQYASFPPQWDRRGAFFCDRKSEQNILLFYHKKKLQQRPALSAVLLLQSINFSVIPQSYG